MEAAESGDEESDQGPQPKKLKTEPYSPKPTQNSVNASQLSRDEYNVRIFIFSLNYCFSDESGVWYLEFLGKNLEKQKVGTATRIM